MAFGIGLVGMALVLVGIKLLAPYMVWILLGILGIWGSWFLGAIIMVAFNKDPFKG